MRKSLWFTLGRKTSFAGGAVRISLIGLACLLLSATGARADSFTYTYAGNDFTTVTGVYSILDKVTGTFDLSSPLPANLANCTPFCTLTDESALLVSYTLSDGVQTIIGPPPSSFAFETDAGGQITDWSVAAEESGGVIVTFSVRGETASDSGSVPDFAFASNQLNPGFWTGPTVSPVPEPATVSMMFSGLLGLGLLVGVKCYRGNCLTTTA
jgi:hypothetical protein